MSELRQGSTRRSARRKRRLLRRQLRFPPIPGALNPSGWHQARPARRVLCGAQYRARVEGSLHSRTRLTGRSLRLQAVRKEDSGTGLPKIRAATLRRSAGRCSNPESAAKDRPRWCRAPRLPATVSLPILGGPDTKKRRDYHATENRGRRANLRAAERRRSFAGNEHVPKQRR